MKKEITIHPQQGKILKTLLFQPKAKFSELNKGDISNDHFAFHIKGLLQAGLIAKNGLGEYILTSIGKEFANRLDVERKNPIAEKQAKIGALIVAQKQEDGKILYLLQKRLKQPYFGFIGFPSGKIKQGETIFETAKRELQEETGLLAKKLKLAGIKHKMDYSPSGDLLEDKFFFVIKMEQTSGRLKETFQGGENFWTEEGKIKNLPNLFPDVLETIEISKNQGIIFSEKKYSVAVY